MSCSFLYLHFKHSLGKQMQGKYLLNEWMNEILRWESLLGKKLFKDPTTWSPLQLSNNRSFRRLPCPVPDIRPGKATEDLGNPATQYGSQHPCWFQGGIRPKSLNLNPRTHFCPNLLFKGFEILSGHYFFFFWPHCAACGILVPRRGIQPVPPAVEARSQPLDGQGSPSVVTLNITHRTLF